MRHEHTPVSDRLARGPASHAADVEDIADTADKQAVIGARVAELRRRWWQRGLDFEGWREREDVVVLSRYAALLEELEEAQMQAQTLLSMRQVEPYRDATLALLRGIELGKRSRRRACGGLDRGRRRTPRHWRRQRYVQGLRRGGKRQRQGRQQAGEQGLIHRQQRFPAWRWPARAGSAWIAIRPPAVGHRPPSTHTGIRRTTIHKNFTAT